MNGITRENALNRIRKAIEDTPELHGQISRIPKNSIILEEGIFNTHLLILMEGTAALIKKDDEGVSHEVDLLTPGCMAGLLSYYSNQPSFSSCIAREEAVVLRIHAEGSKSITEVSPELAPLLHTLTMDNLVSRYRHMVNLNLEVAQLSAKLATERNQLSETLEDLKRTRDQLIHSEKLATLGQLMAGLAHELNNPGAALTRSTETLVETLPELFSDDAALKKFEKEGKLLKTGLETSYVSPNDTHERMKLLEKQHPKLKRSQIRKLSQLPENVLPNLKTAIRDAEKGKSTKLEGHIQFFEIGTSLRSVKLAAGRIFKLIASLRNYGRPDNTSREDLDIIAGLQDTLVILNNRLKHYEVETYLQPLPLIHANGGEINQVWTNILVNACDATGKGGKISISTYASTEKGNEIAVVQICDSGPGIPDDVLPHIFQTNYTTKTGKSGFGLGLGLSISKEIITKYGGQIIASNPPKGGACFSIHLPTEKT